MQQLYGCYLNGSIIILFLSYVLSWFLACLLSFYGQMLLACLTGDLTIFTYFHFLFLWGYIFIFSWFNFCEYVSQLYNFNWLWRVIYVGSTPSQVPRVVVPEELFVNIATVIGNEVNRGLRFLQDVSCEGNLKTFLIVCLYLFSFIYLDIAIYHPELTFQKHVHCPQCLLFSQFLFF